MMDDKMLINLIREHPILYNPSHKNYMDVGMKLSVWKVIGAQMNTEVERCKARWNNIRDNYKKSLKKLIYARRQQKCMKPYRFARHLSFLKMNIDEGELKGYQILPTVEDKIIIKDECKSPSEPEVLLEETTTQEEKRSSTPPAGQMANTSVPTTQLGAFRKRKLVRESPSTVLMKYLLEKKSVQGTTTQAQPVVNLEHPVDAFLFALSPSLKSLPSHLLTLAKSEIFASIQKYETMLTSKGNSSKRMSSTNMELSLEGEEDELQRPLIVGTTEQRTSIGECPETQTVSTTPLSSQTPIEPPSKKQKQSDPIASQNELLKLACELLSSSCKQSEDTNDEYLDIAKVWACKLKALVPPQRRLADRAINEVLFEADMGTLRRNSVQINCFHEPTSVTTATLSDLSAIGSNSVTFSQSPFLVPIIPSNSSKPYNSTVPFGKTEPHEPTQ